MAAAFPSPPYNLSVDQWALEHLLNIGPDDWDALRDLYDLKEGVETLMQLAQKLRRAARVLAECPPADVSAFLRASGAYRAAEEVLRESPRWLHVPNPFREHDWICWAEEWLAKALKANEEVLYGRQKAPCYVMQECLYARCGRVFIAKLGGNGRPREYCRPSHRVRAAEVGV